MYLYIYITLWHKCKSKNPDQRLRPHSKWSSGSGCDTSMPRQHANELHDSMQRTYFAQQRQLSTCGLGIVHSPRRRMIVGSASLCTLTTLASSSWTGALGTFFHVLLWHSYLRQQYPDDACAMLMHLPCWLPAANPEWTALSNWWLKAQSRRLFCRAASVLDCFYYLRSSTLAWATSNPCRCEFSGFGSFCRNRTDDLGIDSPALWPTELVLHRLGSMMMIVFILTLWKIM